MSKLTVKELIKLLEKAPQDFEVQLEGCDCWNLAYGVSIFKPRPNPYSIRHNDYVLIRCDTDTIGDNEVKIE